MPGDRDVVPTGGGLRILVADSLPQPALDDLVARGHDCELDADLGKDDLPDRIRGFDVLVVRSTKVRDRVFEVADRLALVIRAGAGTNTIDTEAAAAKGVLVANVPGRNSAAVAELTMGLLLAIDRRIPDNVADLRAGRWEKKTYGKADGLLGSTLGIVGLGSIGLCVAERATAFGMTVQVVDKPRSEYVEGRVGGARHRRTTRSRGAARDLRRRLPARAGLEADPAPGRQGLPGPPATRGDPAEHLPRRRGRRERAARGARRRLGPRGPGRLRRRAGQRPGHLGVAAGRATRLSWGPTTSVPRPGRRSSPPRWGSSRSWTPSPRAGLATA